MRRKRSCSDRLMQVRAIRVLKGAEKTHITRQNNKITIMPLFSSIKKNYSMRYNCSKRYPKSKRNSNKNKNRKRRRESEKRYKKGSRKEKQPG